jgi:hypothetical protein
MLANTLSPACPPAEQFTRAAHIAGAVRLADVKPQNTRWLWPGRIPLGRVTLLVSDPGLGKSLLTLDIAARVSAGTPWPDQNFATASHHDRFDQKGEIGRTGEAETHTSSSHRFFPSPPVPISPSSVLLLSAEDDLADTVRPRLEALGADCEKILAIDSIPGENANDVPRAFALNRDLARLRRLLDAVPDCRLIIIDPISAFLGATNEHGNADIRTLLAALTTIARERNSAVLIVSHLRKKEGAAIYRTMGSLAFVAAARAVWLLCKDPADSSNRLLLPLKNSLAPAACGLAFVIESRDRTPLIRWSPDTVNVAPEVVLTMPARPRGRPDDDRQYAMSWLKEKIANAPLLVRQVREDAAAFGIANATLRRAFRSLDGQAMRAGFPFKSWYWKLPTTAQKYEGEFCALNTLDAELAEIAKEFTQNTPPPDT